MNARRRVERIQELLGQIGLEPERVRMENMSAAMAGKFVEVAKEMKEKIAEIGPNPLKGSESTSQRIDESPDKANSESTNQSISKSAKSKYKNEQPTI